MKEVKYDLNESQFDEMMFSIGKYGGERIKTLLPHQVNGTTNMIPKKRKRKKTKKTNHLNK